MLTFFFYLKAMQKAIWQYQGAVGNQVSFTWKTSSTLQLTRLIAAKAFYYLHFS